MSFDDNYNLDPGDVRIFDAEVEFGACTPAAQAQIKKLYANYLQAGPQVAQNARTFQAGEAQVEQLSVKVITSDTVRVTFADPLFDGKIEPVAADDRKVALGQDNTWSWQIRPDKPGDYSVPLVVSMIGADGKTVDLADANQFVHLHVADTFSYRLGVAWSAFSGFILGAAGLVVAVGGAVGAWFTFRGQLRARKKETQEDEKKAQGNAGSGGDGGGYL